MKNFYLPPVIFGAFILSLFYWVSLTVVNNMSADSIGYVEIGRTLHQNGWIAFLKTGPHREPLYPLIISWAMTIACLIGIVYSKVTIVFDILMLLIVQFLTYYILRQLNIRTWICFFALLYLGFAPEIINMAFNQYLFSEIVVYPFIPLIILVIYEGWNAVKQGRPVTALGFGAIVGFVFTVATFVKGVFELIFPCYLILILLVAITKNKLSFSLVCFLAAAGLLFYIPITAYKLLNKKYNGEFTVTDSRGPIAFYGNIVRRTEPLTFKNYLVALSYVSPGVCEHYFKKEECNYWSFNESDTLGGQILINQRKSRQSSLDALRFFFRDNFLSKLFKYIFLTITEFFKMFFWGTTNYIEAILVFFGIIYCLLFFYRLPALLRHIFCFIFIYVFFHSLGCILPRYILPLVPLYVIIISYALDAVLFNSNSIFQKHK